MIYYLYWAHNSNNEVVHFMDERFYDIGTMVIKNGESLIIDDYAIEQDEL